MIRSIKRFFCVQSETSVIYDRHRRAENIAALLMCAVISAAFLLICTRSSPLYPLNDWVDSNCFFTVGKSMMHGRVLYRDIYEQKGFLLYLIHGISYLISNTTFLGVYIFEVAFFCAFLYTSYLIARLYVPYMLALSFLPVMSWSVLTSVSFRQGDSAEEFCLPFVLFAIYALLKSIKEGDGSGIPDTRMTFFAGMCAACVLWIKYTLLGIYVGYVVVVVILSLIDGDIRKLVRTAIVFILGALTISLPILIYFAVNGALGDLFTAYFYNNMFLYTDERTFIERLSDIFLLAFRGLNMNKLWGVMSYVGMLVAICGVRMPRASLGVLFMYLGNIFFVYWGGIGWHYYSFGMVALCVLGFVLVVRGVWFVFRRGSACTGKLISFTARRLNGKPKDTLIEAKRRTSAFLTHNMLRPLCFVTSLILCLGIGAVYCQKAYEDSDNVFYMSESRDEIWQTKFAEIICESEDKTMLNYSCLDLGVYTTANIVPSEKYFCRLNLDTDEQNESLDSAVREQRVEFLVIRGKPSRFVKTYYDVIASETSHIEFEGSSISYHLMRRKPRA